MTTNDNLLVDMESIVLQDRKKTKTEFCVHCPINDFWFKNYVVVIFCTSYP